ncbi:MAG: hypothetical protein OEY60_06860 [Nitrospira sp.]|nr:hypothetical protein [Nitrospira sp.]MDH5725178.1 hypothetical protein [Nitrospira sp.]
MAKQSANPLSVPQFIPRYRITLVPEGGHTVPSGLLRDSAAAAAALRPCFAGLDREQFLVCCLDAKNASIGVNVVSIGTLTLSLVHPREVLCAVSYGMVSPFQTGRTWRKVLGSTAYLEGKPKGDKSMLVTQGLSRRC